MEIQDLKVVEINGHIFENIGIEYDDRRKETSVEFYSRSGPIPTFKLKRNSKVDKISVIINGQGAVSLQELNPLGVKKAFQEIFSKAPINADLSDRRRAKILTWLEK